jgi:hypothetical protein
MNDRLREAIAVARSGEMREAQLLVAAVLESSPDNAQAWYVMSHLVDSPARRAAYLYKAVSLDPYNERARAELAQFPTAVTDVLSNTILSSSAEAAEERMGENGVKSDVPEWLRPLAGDAPQRQPVAETSSATEFAAPPSTKHHLAAKASPPAPVQRRRRRDGLLMAVLVTLAIITLVVLGLLAYLLLLQG